MKELIQEIRKSRMSPAEILLTDYIKDIVMIKSSRFPNSLFWKKDGVVVFEQDFKYMVLVCHEVIWKPIHYLFDYDKPTTEIIEDIMSRHLKWKGFRVNFVFDTVYNKWRKI